MSERKRILVAPLVCASVVARGASEVEFNGRWLARSVALVSTAGVVPFHERFSDLDIFQVVRSVRTSVICNHAVPELVSVGAVAM